MSELVSNPSDFFSLVVSVFAESSFLLSALLPHPVNAPIVINPASNKHTVFFIFFPPYYLFHIMKFYVSFSLEGMVLF